LSYQSKKDLFKDLFVHVAGTNVRRWNTDGVQQGDLSAPYTPYGGQGNFIPVPNSNRIVIVTPGNGYVLDGEMKLISSFAFSHSVSPYYSGATSDGYIAIGENYVSSRFHIYRDWGATYVGVLTGSGLGGYIGAFADRFNNLWLCDDYRRMLYDKANHAIRYVFDLTTESGELNAIAQFDTDFYVISARYGIYVSNNLTSWVRAYNKSSAGLNYILIQTDDYMAWATTDTGATLYYTKWKDVKNGVYNSPGTITYSSIRHRCICQFKGNRAIISNNAGTTGHIVDFSTGGVVNVTQSASGGGVYSFRATEG
jgi:hypothetical protein